MLNGHLPDRARAYLTCSLLIPVNKPGGGTRPIAVSEVFYRLACIYALELVRDVLPDVFEPIQLGFGSVGGSERAVHLLQAGLATMGPDAVVLKCDFQNAFNERKREQILHELFTQDQLRPLWRLSHWAYKAPSELLVLTTGTFVRPSVLSKASSKAMVLDRSYFRSLCSGFIALLRVKPSTFDVWPSLMT